MAKEVKEEKVNLFTKISVGITIAVAISMLLPVIGSYVIMFTCIGIISVLGVVAAIVASSQMKKNNTSKGKTLNTVFMIINIVLALIMFYDAVIFVAIQNVEFNDQVLCSQVSECKKTDDEKISECKFSTIEIKCSTEKLSDKQFKDGEK